MWWYNKDQMRWELWNIAHTKMHGWIAHELVFEARDSWDQFQNEVRAQYGRSLPDRARP